MLIIFNLETLTGERLSFSLSVPSYPVTRYFPDRELRIPMIRSERVQRHKESGMMDQKLSQH